MMKQLGQRVSKLEEAMSKRPPRLDGMSPRELLELLRTDPSCTDLIMAAMSEEQMHGVSNLFRALDGLSPELPPPGRCTMAELQQYYPELVKQR